MYTVLTNDSKVMYYLLKRNSGIPMGVGSSLSFKLVPKEVYEREQQEFEFNPGYKEPICYNK